MTHLRKMMLEELERRNYAQTTIECYIQAIEDFARHFHRPPDQLTPEHVREYQAYLFRERKLAASTVTQRLAALRFFYTQTIKKAWSVADTPYPKKTRPLPSILSPEEVAHLITRTCIVSWPPADCPSIAPTGSSRATPSSFPSRYSVASFAASLCSLSNATSGKAS